MYRHEFSYELPGSLIAQSPLADRSSSRLFAVRRASAESRHAHFRDLPELLKSTDVLVINRSRVVPARLFLRRVTGGRVEALMIRRVDPRRVSAWVRSISRLTPGERLTIEGRREALVFEAQSGPREGILRADHDDGDAMALFAAHGHVPLPPYIHRADTEEDRIRYQTVFALEDGSVAAPTAGLHFDPPLLEAIRQRGIQILPLVLHVGPGTFSPVDAEVVEENRLASEPFQIAAETLRGIRDARRAGRRIIAVGTTVTRALESAARRGWFGDACGDRSGDTDLFIYPGFEFQVVDGLVTNFHLPESSLLMLVCGFAGRERTLDWYRQAVEGRYRFYSYGDAMLIL